MISVSQGVVTFIVEFLLIYLVIFIFKTVIEFLLNLILSFFHKSSFTLFKHVLKVNAIFLFYILLSLQQYFYSFHVSPVKAIHLQWLGRVKFEGVKRSGRNMVFVHDTISFL